MDDLKKIMVALDLSPMDEVLAKYTVLLLSSLQAESLTFTHIFNKKRLESSTKKVEGEMINSVSSLHKIFDAKLKPVLTGVNIPWTIEIVEGEINEEILSSVNKHDTDLLIMGRKDSLEGSGGMPRKTVKRCDCSVLFVPEKPSHTPIKILAPTDFSSYSALAVKRANSMVTKQGGEVVCMHIYEVPSGYHKTGKDFNEFAKVMEQHAQNDANKFLKKHKLIGTSIRFSFELDEKGSEAKQIYKFAQEENVDMICMGSKGRTAAASFILGSVAEDLVAINILYPLLVVKVKNKNLGFFEAVSKL